MEQVLDLEPSQALLASNNVSAIMGNTAGYESNPVSMSLNTAQTRNRVAGGSTKTGI